MTTSDDAARASVSNDAAPQLLRARRVYRLFAPVYPAFRVLWSLATRPVEDDLDRLFRERIRPGSRILELAPGTGINIARLFRCSRDFDAYLGIDASQQMLARARAAARSDERIDLRLGDATDLTGVEAGFDFIVCTWLLSHLDAPAETVRDALGKLSPGGTAVFAFVTMPRANLLRRALRALSGPFSFQPVDTEPIRALPGLERMHSCAGGMATLAVFRAAETEGD